MKLIALKMKCALALVVGGILAAGPVMVETPAWAGAGKSGKDEHMDRRDEQKGERRAQSEKSRRDGPSAAQCGHFDERHREIVRQ